MEYLEGGTLGEAVSHFKLEEKQMAYVTKQILIGLSYLHKKNWAHRDLKVRIQDQEMRQCDSDPPSPSPSTTQSFGLQSSNIMLTVGGDIKISTYQLLSPQRSTAFSSLLELLHSY